MQASYGTYKHSSPRTSLCVHGPDYARAIKPTSLHSSGRAKMATDKLFFTLIVIQVFAQVYCVDVKSKYIAYQDGEPVHIQDPSNVPPATCNKVCLHFAHLTKDCECECFGLWKGKICEKCSLRPSGK